MKRTLLNNPSHLCPHSLFYIPEHPLPTPTSTLPLPSPPPILTITLFLLELYPLPYFLSQPSKTTRGAHGPLGLTSKARDKG